MFSCSSWADLLRGGDILWNLFFNSKIQILICQYFKTFFFFSKLLFNHCLISALFIFEQFGEIVIVLNAHVLVTYIHSLIYKKNTSGCVTVRSRPLVFPRDALPQQQSHDPLFVRLLLAPGLCFLQASATETVCSPATNLRPAPDSRGWRGKASRNTTIHLSVAIHRVHLFSELRGHDHRRGG